MEEHGFITPPEPQAPAPYQAGPMIGPDGLLAELGTPPVPDGNAPAESDGEAVESDAAAPAEVPAAETAVEETSAPALDGSAEPVPGEDGYGPAVEVGPEAQDGILGEFSSWLRELVEADGSDLHVKAGSPPLARRAGRLQRLDRAPLSLEQTEELTRLIVPEDRRARFEERGEVDFAHSLPGVGRFRVNVFRQRGSSSMVLRKLRFGGPTFEEVHLPPVVRQLADEPRGLILVTGPTGSGKTTTLAAMIEYINHARPVHVVTIEDPIEVLYRDDLASINQREVGVDTESFLSALRAALRQDPDVILIGEMRDTETVRAALQAAETGHLVMSTLHTVDATETVNRAIDFFPPFQQRQIRATLAGALRGITCQRLVPTVDGGLVPCLEVLVNTGRIAERIEDESKTSEIKDVISEGGFYGMRTFDQSLLELVTSGRVAVGEAMMAASSPHDFQLVLQQAGISASSVGVGGR